MSDYSTFVDPETEEPCPYDKSHMIRRKRMQYHLMKCRKNHPGKEFATCPFNACHEMPRPELRYHITICPDRAVIEKDLVYEHEKGLVEGTLFKGCTDVPAYNSYEVTCSESWDEEVNPHPRIGVDEGFMDKVKFKNIVGMTPAEKRLFHRTLNPEHIPPEDRKSIPDKENQQPVGTLDNHRSLGMPEKHQPGEMGDGKLRLPKNAPKAYSMYKDQANASAQTQQASSTVFAYSLAQSGLGRGRGVGGLGRGVRKPGMKPAVNQHRPGSCLNNQTSAARTHCVPQQAPSYTTAPQYNSTRITPEVAPQYNPAPIDRPNFVHQNNPVPERQTISKTGMTIQQPYESVVTNVTQSVVTQPMFPPGYGHIQSQPDSLSLRVQAPPGVFPEQTLMKPVGRGRGVDTVPPVNNWPSLNNSRDVKHGLPVNSLFQSLNSNDSEASHSGSGSDHGMKGAKKRKQLEKKLRQIETLEEKIGKGFSLNTEEEIKLSKKEELLEELQALRI